MSKLTKRLTGTELIKIKNRLSRECLTIWPNTQLIELFTQFKLREDSNTPRKNKLFLPMDSTFQEKSLMTLKLYSANMANCWMVS